MTPTALDVDAFNAHVNARPVRFGCSHCQSTRLQLNRIALVPDAAAGEHMGQVAPLIEEQATPVALVMCLDCCALQAFAWLPIVAAYTSAVAERIKADVRAVDGCAPHSEAGCADAAQSTG